MSSFGKKSSRAPTKLLDIFLLMHATFSTFVNFPFSRIEYRGPDARRIWDCFNRQYAIGAHTRRRGLNTGPAPLASTCFSSWSSSSVLDPVGLLQPLGMGLWGRVGFARLSVFVPFCNTFIFCMCQQSYVGLGVCVNNNNKIRNYATEYFF
jgi:hypothetical protein